MLKHFNDRNSKTEVSFYVPYKLEMSYCFIIKIKKSAK
jgi:hypothetical protein